MSFVNDLLGDDGTGLTAKDRAGNIAANTAKATTDALLSNYLASESNPAKRAAAILANQGAQAVINKLAAKDRKVVPKPYSSGDENGITLIERDYLKTPEHTYNTYFAKTYAGNMEYNDSHPMMNSLFLVDFKFNDNVVANYPSNKLFSMFGKTLPMSMSFLLKNMTFPKIAFEIIKLNKYNRTITRPKKMQYDPISITFNEIYTSHQTTNNKRVSLMNMMKEYVSYYTNDVVKSGFNLQNGLSSDREFFNFLSSIDIYFFWNTGAKKISLEIGRASCRERV
jgi:hypothetical protein